MPKKANKETHAIICDLEIAKYWGLCTETACYATRILNSNPNMDKRQAMLQGFRKSSELLMPSPVYQE